MTIQLRPYQCEAVDGVFKALDTNRTTLLVAATGTGKTTIFSEVCRRFRPRGRILILAHREELITQAAKRVHAQTGLSVGIEMAQSRANRLMPPDVVVATVQTLCRERRLSENATDEFQLVIVDEAHHAVAETYGKILDYFGAAKVLGVTATPDRGDGTAMRKAFDSVAYVYEIRDAIEQGYLCRVRQKAVQIEGLDLSQVHTVAGDLNEGELEAILMAEPMLYGIVRGTLNESGTRPTMIFGATVAHAHALADLINKERPRAARALDGKSDKDERRATLRDFSAGAFQYLVNCALFTEGFDEPSIACVAVARPTKSRAFYTQMAGRGTRLHPGKTDLLLLDFQGNAGRHRLVCALDILDGNQDEEAKRRAAKKIQEDPQLDIMEALDAASHEIADEKKRAVLARAQYSSTLIDPFAMVATFLDIAPRAGRWDGAPPRMEDVQYLEERAKGLSVAGMDGGQVAEIVAAVRDRYKRQQSSWNQARVLIRAGLDPEVDFKTASRTIDILSGNRWKVTPSITRAFGLLAERKAKEKLLEQVHDAPSRKAIRADIARLDGEQRSAFGAL